VVDYLLSGSSIIVAPSVEQEVAVLGARYPDGVVAGERVSEGLLQMVECLSPSVNFGSSSDQDIERNSSERGFITIERDGLQGNMNKFMFSLRPSLTCDFGSQACTPAKWVGRPKMSS